MKRFTMILAAAALVAVVSCSKDDSYKASAAEDAGDGITVTASFENSDTKTTLDGFVPKWAENDQIKVMNGTESQIVTLALSGNPSTTVGVISEDKRSFSFTVPKSGWENIYAVYPGACSDGTAGEEGVKISIPAQQDGEFAKANICIAKSKSTHLMFKNATAIFRFESKSGREDKVTFTSVQNIVGDFTASIVGDGIVTLSEAGNNAKSFVGTVNQEGYSYFPVASVPIDGTNTLTLSATRVGTCYSAEKVFTSTKTGRFETNMIYKFAPELDYPGAFSLPSGKIIYFSKSNLRYNDNTDEWCFTENQYDRVGDGNFDTNRSGIIDLFGYGASGYNGVDPYSTSTSTDYYPKTDISGTQYDWGLHCPIINGGEKAGLWRTLTMDEWAYIINQRAASTVQGIENARFMPFQIKVPESGKTVDYNGVLLFPDKFAMPEGMSFSDNSLINNKDATPGPVNVTKEQFAELEKAGCVFLVSCGCRSGKGVVSDRGYKDYNGNYWTTNVYAEGVGNYIYMIFEKIATYPYVKCQFEWSKDRGRYGGNYVGMAVRLVENN